MKIDSFGNIRDTNPVKKKPGVQSGIFSSLLGMAETDENAGLSKTSNIVAPSDISSIIALQEVSEEEIRRKKIIKRGEDMLDTLEQLRRQLLTSTMPMHMLQDLSIQLSAEKQDISDPRLLAIIADIELRTAVELAKLEMAVASKATLE